MRIEVLKDFELVDMIFEFQKLDILRRYRGVGDFRLTLNNLEYTNSLEIDNIIYFNNEAYIIQNYQKYKNIQNEMNFIVSGKHINSILERRVLLPSVTINTTETYEVQMRNLINTHFINPADPNRKINNLVLANLKGYPYIPTTTSTLEDMTVREALTQLSSKVGLGYNLICDIENKQFIFEVIEGQDKTEEVFFSEEFGNVLDSEIYKKTDESINVCYLNNSGAITSTGIGIGLNRKEAIIPGQNISEATEEIERRKDIISAECEIAMTDQFVYKEDWDLGDIVTFIDKTLGFIVERPVLEIKEYYTDRLDIDVVFGDRVPTIFEKMGW